MNQYVHKTEDHMIDVQDQGDTHYSRSSQTFWITRSKELQAGVSCSTLYAVL